MTVTTHPLATAAPTPPTAFCRLQGFPLIPVLILLFIAFVAVFGDLRRRTIRRSAACAPLPSTGLAGRRQHGRSRRTDHVGAGATAPSRPSSAPACR